MDSDQSPSTPQTGAKIAPVDHGYRQVAFTTTVAAPPHEVFALVGNPHHHHLIDGSGTVRLSESVDEPLRVGSHFTMNMRMVFPYRIQLAVTAFAANRLIEWRHPQGHLWRWELQGTGAGSTEVLHVWNYSRAFAPWTLELAGFPARNGRGMQATLARLQQAFLSPTT